MTESLTSREPRPTYALEPSYVAGLTRLIRASGNSGLPVYSPLSAQPIGDIPQSSIHDVEVAFGKAREAQQLWATTSLQHRAKLMLNLHDLMLDRLDECLDLIVTETGKARRHAFEEPLHIALTARYLARKGPRVLKTSRVNGIFPFLTRAEINHLPRGVVGVISPWNYPLAMGLCDGLAALMAGNTVVAKPDAQTVLTMAWGVRQLRDAGFPEAVWQIVAGPGPITGQQIVNQADYVAFTGSTATGKLIARGCADRLIGCSLELGGKNAMVVLADADVKQASEIAVRACFSNAGQLCVSIERIYVHEAIADRFTKQFVKQVAAMRTGASLGWDNDMGGLISDIQLERVKAHVDDAVLKGATVLTGGQPDSTKAPYFFEPTVLGGVTDQMDLYRMETFGPVVSLATFATDKEAVSLVNDSVYGLNASIATRDVYRGRSLAKRLKAGGVNLNEGYSATFGSIAQPMGGMGQSGLGRRQGTEGILRFTQTQAVSAQRLLPIAPALGLTDEQWAKAMKAAVRALKRTRRA
jgi:succinate-semialdehyde dehydrogenase / glutarate-semialdehyde dehydrogenase